MSLVMDTLRTSTITEELSDTEVEMLAGLFKIQDFKSGEVIVRPGDEQPDNLYILAHGDIAVKIESGGEESTIHVLKTGDLAGIISFVGRAASDISAELSKYIYRFNGRY